MALMKSMGRWWIGSVAAISGLISIIVIAGEYRSKPDYSHSEWGSRPDVRYVSAVLGPAVSGSYRTVYTLSEDCYVQGIGADESTEVVCAHKGGMKEYDQMQVLEKSDNP